MLLGWGASESNWGAAGSIFGVKQWEGSSKAQTYDTWEAGPNGERIPTRAAFEVYDTPDQAFQALGTLLNTERYRPAFQYVQQTGDAAGFLRQINDAGYATDRNWANSVVSIANSMGQGNLPDAPPPGPGKVAGATLGEAFNPGGGISESKPSAVQSMARLVVQNRINAEQARQGQIDEEARAKLETELARPMPALSHERISPPGIDTSVHPQDGAAGAAFLPATSQPSADVGDTPYASGQGAPGTLGIDAVMKRAGLGGTDYGKVIRSGLSSVDNVSKPVLEPVKQALGDAAEKGIIGLGPTAPLAAINSAVREQTGAPNVFGALNRAGVESGTPTTLGGIATTVGPGNILKAGRGIAGGVKEADLGLGIVAKNRKQLADAFRRSMQIGEDAKQAVLKSGGSVAEARQAGLKAIREAQAAEGAVQDAATATDRAVSSDPYTNTGKRLRGTAQQMSERMGPGVVEDGGSTSIRYHQTSPENAEAIRREGFRLDKRGSGDSDILPVGVSTKGTDANIGLQGAGEQLKVRVADGLKIRNFASRDAAERFLKDSDTTYAELVKQAEQIDSTGAKRIEELSAELATMDRNQGTRAARQVIHDEQNRILSEDDSAYRDVVRKASARATEIMRKAGFDGMYIERDVGGPFGKGVTDNLIIFDPKNVNAADTALSNEADVLDWALQNRPKENSTIGDIAKVARDVGDPFTTARHMLKGSGEPDTVNAASNKPVAPKQAALPGLEASPETSTLWDGIQTAAREVSGAVGGVRTLSASGDMGHILRQGQALGWANPKVWKQMAGEGTRAFRDADYAVAKQAAMKADPEFAKAEKAGLKIYEFGKDVASEARGPGFEGLNASNVSKLLEDLPHVAGGERSLAVALNHQGFEVFKQWSKGVDDPKQLAALADVINHARGYSAKGGLVEQVSKLNALFSAQYTASRFNVLADPLIELAKGNRQAAKLATTNLLSMAGGNVAMLGFMGLTGSATGKWSVNADPLSSDFGQLRFGNSTRIDTLGGMGPLIKTIAKVSVATGVAGEDAQSQVKDINQTLLQFFENKQAPVFGMIEKYIVHGQVPEFKDPRFWAELVTPMMAWDIYDAVKENEGANKLLAAPVAIASGAGAGASSYSTPADAADAIAQQAFDGRKYDDLTPLERARVVTQLPDDAMRKGKERFNADLKAAKTAAGYDDPSADTKALDRSNPEIDAQEWIVNGGSVASPAAIDLALQSGVEGRDLRLAGLKRAVNQDENSRKAWEASKKPIDWYLNDVVPKNADKFIAEYAKGKDGAVWKKADGTLYTLEQLPPELKTKVSSAIKAQALDPEMEAWLAWWGQRDLPKNDAKVRAQFDKITARFGSKQPETLTRAVIAGVKAAN